MRYGRMCNEHIPLTLTTESRATRGRATRQNEFRSLLRLSSIRGFGPHRIAQLVAHFGSAESVMRADRDALVASGQVNAAGAKAIADCQRVRLPENILRRFERPKSAERVLLIGDPEYPPLLRRTGQPPLWLWMRGTGGLNARSRIAIVGSRDATRRGQDLTREWCYRLASQGVIIVSGLASGIDTAAHQGALDAGGQTIAVMGTGLDVVYPNRNRALAADIAESGLLVTEYHPGEGALPHHFPRRNRIIAGLCHATVVMEAGKGSGSLITAKIAQDEGREVGIVPGRPGDRNAAGSNLGIRENIGELISDVEDVFVMLNRELSQPGALQPDSGNISGPGSGPEATVARRRPAIRSQSVPGMIREALQTGPLALDGLLIATGETRARLEEALLDLLLDGRIVLESDQRYRWRR